jgi:hypothetical protein
MTEIESRVYADGSFGLRAGRNGGVMDVYFCGGEIATQNGVRVPTGQGKPCAHATRREAEKCEQRAGR